MDVHFTPDTQVKLEQLQTQTGLTIDQLLEDAVAGYFGELAKVRGMLDDRYDEIKSGKVRVIDGEEAFQRLMETSEAQRKRKP